MSGPVGHVVVAGGSRAGWLGALALQRAFARTGLTVTLIEMDGDEPRLGVICAPPDLARLHRLLGIGEGDLLREAGAGWWLGEEWIGWSGGTGGFLHGFGEVGRPIAGLPFLPFWIKARAGGLPVPLADFVLAAAAARHGRLPRAGEDGPEPGTFLDARGYRALLRDRALAAGVRSLRTATVEAVVRDGQIAGVRLGDGGEVTADLFVDASGPGACLIRALSDEGDAGGSQPPCDRMLVVTGPPLRPLPLYDRITAHPAGWLALRPLAAATEIQLGYGTAHWSDEQARTALAGVAGPTLAAAAVAVELAEGIRRRPWIGNCVAIGAAAAQATMPGSFAVTRDQIGVGHLLSLFPVNRQAMPERDLFNSLTEAQLDRLRDFGRLPFAVNGRVGEPFWDQVRAAPKGPDLQMKLDLFAARGMVAQGNGESVAHDSWQQMMIGLGVAPRSHDPQADRTPDAEVARALQAVLGYIRDRVQAMPTEAERRKGEAAS